MMAELRVGADLSFRASFYFWMAVAMCAIVFSGFGISYFAPMATGTLPPLAPVVHVHGFFYFSWMILLLVQSSLIARGNVALHRSLGLLGIGVATGLMIFGSIITALFAGKAIAAADPTIYGLTYTSLLAVFEFGILFWLAIRHIRDPQAHRRYILLATAAFLTAGLNRLYGFLFGLGFESHLTYVPRYLTVDLLIVAMLLYDRRSLGRLHRATVIGAAVNVVPQLLHAPIVDAAAFRALTEWLASIARYA